MGHDARSNATGQQVRLLSSTRAYDRFGRVLQEGDVVIVSEFGAVLWNVQRVAVSMHPQAPPGTVEIALQALWSAPLKGGQPQPGIIKVRGADVALKPEETPLA